MKRTRYSEEQIIGVLKEAEAGAKTADLARRYGASEATIYNYLKNISFVIKLTIGLRNVRC